MKASFLSSPLRSLSVALLCAGALSSTASAVSLISFDGDIAPSNTAPVEAYDYADGIIASDFAGHGSTTKRPSGFRYINWGTALNEANYAGFTLSAEEGSQITLTDFSYNTGVSAGNISAWRWGYRVDEGTGFSAWNFDTTYAVGDAGFGFSVSPGKVFDFADFTTTGVVEFGLFAQSSDLTSNIIVGQNIPGGDISANGTITAVPEPSTYGLLIGAGLAAWFIARRRKSVVAV